MEMMRSTSDLWMAHSRRSLTSLRRGDLCRWQTLGVLVKWGELRSARYLQLTTQACPKVYTTWFIAITLNLELRERIWGERFGDLSRVCGENSRKFWILFLGAYPIESLWRLSSSFSLIVEALSTKVISDIVRVLFPRLSKEFQSILR